MTMLSAGYAKLERPPTLDRRLIADPGREPAWRPLGIEAVRIDGRRHMVHSEHEMIGGFSVLIHHRVEDEEPRQRVLLVMPLSGHHGVMMRDLIVGLLESFDVSVLDWINARHVPVEAGLFGFADNVAATVAALGRLGQASRAHLIGICQSGTTATLAASALHQAGAATAPRALVLLCSPIEPAAQPTRVSSLLTLTTDRWLAESLLSPVPEAFAGRGRMVYPAELQQARLMQYLNQHLMNGTALGTKLVADDGFDAGRFPFLERVSQLKDIAGLAFRESIAAIYHDGVLWNQGFAYAGEPVRPRLVRDMALMTVEAEGDDITAPGQTAAAQRLFVRIPDDLREHLLLDGGSHFSTFHGRQAMTEVVPAIGSFLRLADGRFGDRRN